MINSKITAAAALSSLLLLTLSACGKSSPEQGSEAKASPEGQSSSSSATADAVKKVTDQHVEITFFTANDTFDTDQFMNEQGGSLIQKKFPNFTIKNIMRQNGSQLQDLVATGQNFDILRTSLGSSPDHLVGYGLQSDITDLINKYHFDLSRLAPSTVDAQKQLANGGMYGMPFRNNVLVLTYNKNLFDKFGVAYPKDGMTWDDTYELAKKMTRKESDGTEYRGYSGTFAHLMIMNPLSAGVTDAKAKKSLIAGDAFSRVFDNIARFYKISGNGLPDNKYGQSVQYDLFFKNQNTAMSVVLSDDLFIYASNLAKGGIAMNWDMVNLPSYKDKPGVAQQPYPYYYYMTSMTKNRDAVFQVLAYVTSDEFQQWVAGRAVTPILKDSSKLMAQFGAGEPLYKGKNVKALLPNSFADPAVNVFRIGLATEVQNALVDYVSKGADLNTALRQATERQDKAITESLNK
jgi:multiple sugar transport system substrate-binding protein